jgi:hypothetical protein
MSGRVTNNVAIHRRDVTWRASRDWLNSTSHPSRNTKANDNSSGTTCGSKIEDRWPLATAVANSGPPSEEERFATMGALAEVSPLDFACVFYAQIRRLFLATRAARPIIDADLPGLGYRPSV